MKPTGRIGIAAVCLAFAAPAAAPAQDRAEVNLARQLLSAAQAPSIRRNIEYCGTIGVDQYGRLVASQPRRGRRDSCEYFDHDDAVEIVASYHTHAGFDVEADSEVPSVEDVLGDMEAGTDGYVATPGGRLWFVDGQTGVVRQLCGLGCLPSDPRFVAGAFGRIANRYTLDQLDRRDRSFD